MRRLFLVALLAPVAVFGQMPTTSYKNLQYDANGNILPTTTNGHVMNLPAGTTLGGAAIVTGTGLPSQTGNSGKYLTTNGTVASWARVTQLYDNAGTPQLGLDIGVRKGYFADGVTPAFDWGTDTTFRIGQSNGVNNTYIAVDIDENSPSINMNVNPSGELNILAGNIGINLGAGFVGIGGNYSDIVVTNQATTGTIKMIAPAGVRLNATSLVPDLIGDGATIGTRLLPFPSVFIGNAATNNIQLTGTATSAQTITLPDATGTLLTTTGSAANLTNFPTLNQNTTGSAASLSVSGQTGLLTFTGLTSTNRAKTVRDAADTILELGGSYTPTGTWTSMPLTTPKITTGLNDANGNEQLRFTATASAIDDVTITNAASGNRPSIKASGDSTNISLELGGKGTGQVYLGGRVEISDATVYNDTTISFSVNSTTKAGLFNMYDGGTFRMGLERANGKLALGTAGVYAWGTWQSYDTGLARNAAGVVEINNGTAGTYRDLKLRKLTGVQTAAGTVTSTYSLDVTLGRSWTLTTTASTNLTITPTGTQVADQVITLIITSDATGGDVVTFASPFKTTGTMTLTASKVHTIQFISDGTNLYEVARTVGL